MICHSVGMADKKNPLGPTGEIVRLNVARLRGGMQYKVLSEKLDAVGRPIPPLGLRRIEAGERRVDVDDLVALAVVFGVSPLTLLLPEDGTRLAASPMTGVVDRKVAHNTQWLWGLCEEPLSLPGVDRNEDAAREVSLFQQKAKPRVEERSNSYTWKFTDEPDSEEARIARDEEALATSYRASVHQGLIPVRKTPRLEVGNGND